MHTWFHAQLDQKICDSLYSIGKYNWAQLVQVDFIKTFVKFLSTLLLKFWKRNTIYILNDFQENFPPTVLLIFKNFSLLH